MCAVQLLHHRLSLKQGRADSFNKRAAFFIVKIETAALVFEVVSSLVQRNKMWRAYTDLMTSVQPLHLFFLVDKLRKMNIINANNLTVPIIQTSWVWNKVKNLLSSLTWTRCSGKCCSVHLWRCSWRSLSLGRHVRRRKSCSEDATQHYHYFITVSKIYIFF